MTDNRLDGVFDVRGAAAYCGMTPRTIRHHIYTMKDLKADRVYGGVLVFSKETLDAFMANKRPMGRPPGYSPKGQDATPEVTPSPVGKE